MAATTYGARELYGGAMTVQLPVELIDSSDIRQIPDHQEVFLSPTTLTSIIFEINDYVRPPSGGGGGAGAANNHLSPSPGPTTTTSTTTAADGTTTTTTTTAVSQVFVTGSPAAAAPAASPQGTRPQEELDAEAAKYHFTDVISPPDTLASPLPDPQPIKMVDPSLAGYPAYMLAGNINSHEMAPRSSSSSLAAPNASSSAATSSATLHHHPTSSSNSSSASRRSDLISLVHQLALLIRLQPYNADVCVRINVPVKEFVEAGQRVGSPDRGGATDAMIAEEVGKARDVFAHIVGTLAVRDWHLFNP
ncbi:uncharacterized protein Z520_01033 [Fonsecaea multimorphosa CBS 102226]|uniref:Uncharacterized protein n=1 Tax=Fonsecaea multimorphosa CBS 102226 TaxID=1442371 RepID=A0A0D2K912_9EURO|nr:uncharacterized protein Z520_01033 [Fonsecaea multimorphosa CBS 102226]KIY02568.1 hypothetical protein Z520_01033 [Fonsecaea multimorphosa CBS 102226]OAL31434.1 hypothetical protein AYO22_01026 [Fonsecaea multimorphosa]